jgi:hypothetical protein
MTTATTWNEQRERDDWRGVRSTGTSCGVLHPTVPTATAIRTDPTHVGPNTVEP